MNGERPTGYWWYKQVSVPVRQRFSKRVRPQCLCENLINALKLLANQQKDGETQSRVLQQALCERNRKGIVEGLSKCIKVDNYCVLDVGHLNEGIRYEGRSSKRDVPRCQSGKVPRN